ncbi:MAG: hypothetical protein JNN06_10035, partial [Gemmobacter sp.]|uniref:hypothetical protein n=1 Tax=Gemmobacter sp. TaxID=1898957 RepID=UPI001A62072B
VYRARLEMMMGRPREALAVMSEVLAARARFPEAQHHRIALAAGEGWRSAQILAEKLVSDGGSLRELATASGYGRDAAGWTRQSDDLTGPDWWRAAVTLLHGARASTQPVTEAQIRAVLDLTQGVAEREAARLMMEERAAKLWRMDISDILNRLLDTERLPTAYADHAAILLAARFLLHDETQMAEAQRQLRNPDLLCPARLATLVEYLRRFSEDLPGLLNDAQAALHRAEGARAELQLRVAALALSIGETGAARAALALGAVPKSSLHRYLKVAAFTGDLASPRLEALAAAAPDDLGFAQRVADPALTVAVVGNGVLAADLPPGAIDSHDIVIRINDFLLGDAWGERVDYHVTVMQGQVGFGQQHLSRVRFGTLLRNGDLAYRSRDWGPTLQMLELGHPVGILPSAQERALSREIGTEPSTGLAILTAILALRGTMRGLSVFGMPMLMGADDDRRAQGDICHQRHFWQREAGHLRKMMG